MCNVDGCTSKIHAKGHCSKHYRQIQRNGKILIRSKKDPNEIIIHKDYAEICLYDKDKKVVAKSIIDLDAVEKVSIYKWRKLKNGYVITHNKDKSSLYLHRLICDYNGDLIVDHINRDKLNNKRENLRVTTYDINNRNKDANDDVGVYFDERNNVFVARISYNKKHLYLGTFTNKEDAKKARRDAEEFYWGGR